MCRVMLYPYGRETRDTMTSDDAAVAAFDRLYNTEFETVHRYACARLGRSEGEEVTSEVFHAAAIACADGDIGALTGAWLMAVTRNKVIDRWRRAQRSRARRHLFRAREEDLMEEIPDRLARDETRAAVRGTLDRLNSRHRGLLILHYVDGMSVPEIAASLDESMRAVESALARARRAFERNYRGEGVG